MFKLIDEGADTLPSNIGLYLPMLLHLQTENILEVHVTIITRKGVFSYYMCFYVLDLTCKLKMDQLI